jgi:hypothetical protein
MQGMIMDSQMPSSLDAMPNTKVKKAKGRGRQKIDHAEIVRMAVTEATNRATERHEVIAAAAYFRAQKRGFEPGHDLEDWFAAETEIAHAQQFDAL